MILKLNTTICPIVCIGTYQTFLSPDYIYERDCCEYDHAFNKGLISEDELDYLHEASYKYFDFMNYLNTIGQYALNEISEFFDDINHFLKIKLANQSYEVYSPREYNFQTDGMDYFVEIDEREIDNLGTRLKGNNKFLTWIYDSYRTKSGFISFMPYTEEMFFDALAGKDIERALSMYLMGYYIRNFWMKVVMEIHIKKALRSTYQVTSVEVILLTIRNTKKL